MGTHPIFESDFDCLTGLDSIRIEMNVTKRMSGRPLRQLLSFDYLTRWTGYNNRTPNSRFFFADEMTEGYATRQLDTLYRSPHTPASFKDIKLDGWSHTVGNSGGINFSKYRVPEAVDSTNWTPLTDGEKELFDKRLEFGAKNRRRFWEMKYNPKTEGYFCGQTSDRAWAQHDWVNSVWFEQAACNQNTSYFMLGKINMFILVCIGGYVSHRYNQNMLGPGMANAPATDMVNFEIEVIDMARNNYTPIGYYKNGEFKPHQSAAPVTADNDDDDEE